MSVIKSKRGVLPIFRCLLLALFVCIFSSSSWSDTLNIPLKGEDIKLTYWPAQNNHHGALIWIRSDASTMPESIAETLSGKGWAILLIDSKPSTELHRQIPGAIRELRKLHYQRVILLHQGDRLQKTLDYFIKPQSKRVDGFIFLSAYESKRALNLMKISSPVMDICGQFDYQYVLADFQQRKEQERYRNYRAIQIPGADYRYEYQLNMLLSYMDGWMKQLPPIQPAWLPFQLGEMPQTVYGTRIASLLRTITIHNESRP